MSNFDSRQVLMEVFSQLRRNGFSLGMGELLAALQVVSGGWGAGSLDELRQVAQLLWCNSLAEMGEFETIWTQVVVTPLSSTVESATHGESLIASPPPESQPLLEVDPANQLLTKPQPVSEGITPGFGILPVQVPFRPALLDELPELHAYWPVSQRDMVYAWRYLRRLVADGPADVLDLLATVERAVRQGFFLSPVYRRREQNYAHLVLLLDQGGSMMPFHRFTRDIVATAQHESNIQQVDVFYFHNTPADHMYLDPYMTQPVELDQVLAQCSSDTSLLIVSDAGAARGYRRPERIRATTRFLNRLRGRTALIAWLNPMLATRWSGSSAQIIAHMIPMFQMDEDGMASAIDVVRGQPLHHTR